MKLGAAIAPPFVPRLAGFIAFLRLRGLPIGIGTELDCARALERISILNRDAFLDACKVTLAKSPGDVTRLEEAFDVYWNQFIDAADSETPLAVSAPRRPPPDGLTSGVEAPPAQRMIVDQEGVLRVGMYSPDAPSLGHTLTLSDRKRLLAVRAGVRRFRRQTATLPGRRLESARHGAIDFLATARHSLREGGEWVEFRFQRRKRLRGEHVVLWDVSGSMRDHDATMFALVYSLHRLIRRTKVFAFGTQLEDVTDHLRGRAYARAAQAISQRLGPLGGGTRIGPCLADFLRQHSRLLHPWTTLVILSDGWDLGDTRHLGAALERLRRLCRRIVWVNPYADDPRFEPATAGMREALPHVDLLLGPADFHTAATFAPERIAARRPGVRSRRWGKAFITGSP